MNTRAKELRFEASIDAERNLAAEGCPPVTLPDEWTAEHLLLAALLRCSLTSLAHHATRADARAYGRGTGRGMVTKRESDGRYAFVEIELVLDVDVRPRPDEDALAELLAKAERDCFIAASLTARPRYEWRVNGVTARAAPW